jgi:3',5'-nucleoside bisphosphate phosphatase
MRIDLHTHSDVSDGTDSPAELIRAARRAGLDVIALTDHDTFDGLDEATATGDLEGVTVLRGMELSCARLGQSVHLLAYGADPGHAELSGEMERVRGGREARLAPVLAKLAELGVPVSEAEVMAQVGDSPSLGRPHIADAMVLAGHVRDRTEAFDRFLADGGPAHIPRYTIEIGRGVDLVHAAGGVAVIAHPWGRGKEQTMPSDVLAALVRDHGLDGIEADHQDHDLDDRARLRALAEDLGVLITGSSDYHGTGKVGHDLGCNTTAEEVYIELARRLGVAA